MPAKPLEKLLAAVAALLLAAAVPVLAQDATPSTQAPPPPCSDPEYRQFDFWLGEWEVRGPAGKLAGTSSIRSEHDGCVIHERYDTGRGYDGESLNIYDKYRRLWHQTWVDTTGMLLELEGGLRDGSMVLEGQSPDAEGRSVEQRITWTPNADGSVRQLWESKTVEGDWQVLFDGRYTRRISTDQ